MNKWILLLAFLTGSLVLHGQNAAVTNAILYHKDGVLDKAKREIDAAIVNDKTKTEPKAWYYKGIVYADISRSDNASYKTLAAEPLREAVEAFEKAKTLDPSKGEFYKLSDNKLKELWPEVINHGIQDYEAEKTKDALAWFELAQTMNPRDTTGYVYASYAAEALGDAEALRKYTGQLVQMNHKSAYVYRNLILLEKDPVKKLETAREAHAAFPQDASLTEALGDTYAEQGKNQEAIQAYQELYRLAPDHTTILTKIALQYEKLKQPDKALELYEKISRLDSKNFLAHYNASIIYYEKGKELYDRIHKLSVSDYQAHGKQMESDMNALFDQSLTHARAAIENTQDESDKNNARFLISEIQKITKK